MQQPEREESSRSEQQELLDRHAPLLRYDPQDLYRALSAESAIAR